MLFSRIVIFHSIHSDVQNQSASSAKKKKEKTILNEIDV